MSVDQLRPRVRRLAEAAENRAYNWLTATGRTRDDYRDALNLLAASYAETAGLLALGWYDEQDADSSYSAYMDPDLADEKMDAIADWVFAGPQLPENRGRLAAHRIVFDAARRTVFVNAASEGVAIARHEQAGSCDKCRSRASFRPRPRTAGTEGVDQDFHPRCEGLFVPVRTELWTPPEYMSDWGDVS